MLSTPVSLLERLRYADEAEAWNRFVELYSPLLFHWAEQLGLQTSDCADLVQDVFLILWRELPKFEYDRTRSFHAWVRTLFLNRHRSRCRERMPALVDGNFDELPEKSNGDFIDAEYSRYLIRQAFRLIELEFAPLHQKIFRAYALEERGPEEIAREHGVNVGTVYAIKSKVLGRLRQELRLLLD
jgi:RNA polymerase sigma-70 factor (ECF subfamily)